MDCWCWCPPPWCCRSGWRSCMVSVRYLNLRWIGCTNLNFSVRNSGTLRQRRSVLPQMYRCCSNPHFSVRNSGTARRRCDVLPQMYRCCTNLHFSVRNSGTPRRRCGTLRQRRSVTPFVSLRLPPPSAREVFGRNSLPFAKRRCFILKRMKRRGERHASVACTVTLVTVPERGATPRKRGVYCHHCDRTK